MEYNRNKYSRHGEITIMQRRHTPQKTFKTEQFISASEAVRKFSALRKQARNHPVIILDNNNPDTVMISYETYEALHTLLQNSETPLKNENVEEKQQPPFTQRLSDEELQFLGIKTPHPNK